MKPAPFEFESPATVQEVLDRLEEEPEAELMAGNQSLGIVMSNRLAAPDHIIDLNEVDELAFVEETDEAIEVGAMTCHRTIERSDLLDRKLSMLSEAAAQIAGPSVRNRGTVGGSIGEADPAGNYPTALLALDATITIRSVDETREVPVSDYFIAYMFTDLRENELIERVTIPTEPFPPERTGMTFEELKRTGQTWPTVSAAAVIRVDDPAAEEPQIEEARLALANVDDVPLRVEDAEATVEGGPLSETALSTATDIVVEASNPEGEMHADEEYKEEAAGEYARIALETAFDRATQSQ
ncbi:xanthine dehydrogenase family protein subunit M [Haloarcula sp. JP-L23]|uniref:FAD binding domain-containing protein n=1 Tax=Haloarcula sp. JP-L23 TaxID=2716717 RepID=UPI00140EEC6C|nr:xanthine dehydrogenase family protein subunit M [Haloarcula sp. JP-L23]